MVYRPHLLGLAALVLLACGPQVAIDDDASDTGDSSTGRADDDGTPSTSGSIPPSVTTGMGPTTAPPVTSADSVGDVDVDDADSVSFITVGSDSCGVDAPEGTSFHCSYECDTFAQDCPADQKCMPWANDGGTTWNANRCSPLDANPRQLGETCTAEGSGVSGIDDCDIGLMCWNVDENNAGHCIALCSGSPDDPICPGDGFCALSGEGVLALCLDTCDPLANDCAMGMCIPGNDAFVCADVPGGDVPVGSSCDFPQECVAGSACIDASFGECEGVGCCASYCDLSAGDPEALCMPGQTCIPWWERGQAPKQWANVGVCGVPQ